MLDVAVLRSALSAFSTMFGSLGVFCDYLSFLKPQFAAQAVVFLGIAMAILRYAPEK